MFMPIHPLASATTSPHEAVTWVDLMRFRAQKERGRIAFRFLRGDESDERSRNDQATGNKDTHHDGAIGDDTICGTPRNNANGGAESPLRELTFEQLDVRARAIGAHLASLDLAGERVLLAFPPGLEFITAFFGCLYAGAIAVPTYPPRPHREDRRLVAIAVDSKPALILSVTSVLENTDARVANHVELAPVPWVAVDGIDDQQAESWSEPTIDRESIAFLQYTSGSTSTPKGVMVSHANLFTNARDVDLGCRHDADSLLVSWLPLFHDLGLIYGVLQPIFKGFPAVLMPPVRFLQRPKSWLEAISTFKATHSAAPNFAYELCCDKIPMEERRDLDLSHWRMTVNAADPGRAETLARFAEDFADCGYSSTAMTPSYGLAECTLKATSARADDPPLILKVDATALGQGNVVTQTLNGNTRVLVGCGRSETDTEIVIVDPQAKTACPSDQIGEIWIRGNSVAGGYWQREESTAETFQAFMANGQGPFLRSGDLGFRYEGELFVTGRLEDVIIVRGLNHYPQDIELTVERSHSSLRPGCGAAFSVERDGVELLAIAQEVRREQLRTLDETAVFQSIQEDVYRHHELPVQAIVLLKPASVPKTSSGKIQRSLCRQYFLDNSLATVARWQRIQHRPAAKTNTVTNGSSLRNWLVQWLQTKLSISPEDVELDRSFTHYGLDSVTTVELAIDLEELTHQTLEPTTVWSYPTIRRLSDYLVEAKVSDADQALGSPTVCPCNSHALPQPIEAPDDLAALSDQALRDVLASEVSALRQWRMS